MSFLNTIGLFTEHDVETARFMWKTTVEWFSDTIPLVSYRLPLPDRKVAAERALPIQGSLVYPYHNLDDSLRAMKAGQFGCNGDVVGMNALSSEELNAQLGSAWEGREAGYNMEISFKDAQFNVVELEEDVILYRGGQKHRTMGQFFARTPPAKRFDVRFNSAVLTEWSSLDTVYEVRVPRNTILFDGYIAPQGNFHLGLGQQIFIRKPWMIPGLEESARVVDRWSGDGRSMGTFQAILE